MKEEKMQKNSSPVLIRSKKELVKPSDEGAVETVVEPPLPTVEIVAEKQLFKHDSGGPEIILSLEDADKIKELDDLVLEGRKWSRKYKISDDPEDGIKLADVRIRYRELWEKISSGRKINARIFWNLFN
jgi:hypothetical protein